MSPIDRLLVDATAWSNRRGEGRYLRGLLPELLGASVGLETFVLVEESDRALLQGALGGRAEPIGLSARPGSKLASGRRRTPLDLAVQSAAARRLRARVVLQPTLVGWFPTPGIPQVVGVHDIKPGGDLGREIMPGRLDHLLGSAKQRAGMRTARALFVPSVTTQEALAARLGGAVPRVAPPAIDAEFRSRSEPEVAAARHGVGLGPDEPYLVCASGLNRHKDPGLLIDALALGRSEGRRMPRLVLVGARRGAYGSIGDAIQRRAVDAGLGDAVLMPGHLPDPTLAALYSDAVAVVSASRFEGYGLTAVEAAACGAPLVLSRIPAHLETSGRWARFFEPGDAAGLLAALHRADRCAPDPPPPDAYSWAPAAEAVLACVYSVAAGPRSSHRSSAQT